MIKNYIFKSDSGCKLLFPSDILFESPQVLVDTTRKIVLLYTFRLYIINKIYLRFKSSVSVHNKDNFNT